METGFGESVAHLGPDARTGRSNDEETPALNGTDTGFVLISAALVMVMTPGLALFYGGMVRSKSVLNMLMMSFISLGIVSVLWVLYGHSLAFSGDSGGFIGNLDMIGLKGVDAASTTASFVTDENGKAHQIATFAFSLPDAVRRHHCGPDQRRHRRPRQVRRVDDLHRPMGHRGVFPGRPLGLGRRLARQPRHPGDRLRRWYRGPHQRRYRRARSGPRDRQTRRLQEGPDAAAQHAAGPAWHRPALVRLVRLQRRPELGVDGVTAQMAINTQVATGAAMLGWLIYERIRHGAFTTLGACSGAVAGLVAITPSGGNVNIFGALLIGVVAGAVCSWAVSLKYKLGYDDSLDVVGVHLVGGVLGTLMVGFLAIDGKGGWDQFLSQAIGAFSVMGYTFVVTYILAFAIQKTIGFRASEDDEISGIDQAAHAETAYDFSSAASSHMSATPSSVAATESKKVGA